MLQQSDRKAKLFNVFIGVVALKSDSLCFLFGQLMVQVTPNKATLTNNNLIVAALGDIARSKGMILNPILKVYFS